MITILSVAPIFSDHMVLQREKNTPVWGNGTDGRTVRLLFNGRSYEATVHNGKWCIVMPPFSAGTHGSIEINDGDTRLYYHDVVFGDVWFAGGQSNMELELQNSANGAQELANAAHHDIRFYQPLKQSFVDDAFIAAEKEGRWRVCGPDTAAALSAVAYFFARHINADVTVPIGIINGNWGGTSISAWMSGEQLARSVAGQKYLDDYAALVGDKTDAQYATEMEEYFADWRAWDARVQVRRAQEPNVTWDVLNVECGLCPWPQPAGTKSPYRPSNLYHSMIKRVAPFGLKGFLYYQGEEDWNRAADYCEMMCYLIDQWRSDWGDNTLPFLFVQLPMYASRDEVAAGLHNDESWQVLRENQYKASQIVANTGLAVIIDRGEFDNIHPLDKYSVGYRLALQALKKVYGRAVEADGPVFNRAEREGNIVWIYFDHAESGFFCVGNASGIELAGSDDVYYPAIIEEKRFISSNPGEYPVRYDSALIAYADAVPEPERVRYAWYKYGPTPLYGGNEEKGLPVMPFRATIGTIW